jgi:hypothetical protein
MGKQEVSGKFSTTKQTKARMKHSPLLFSDEEFGYRMFVACPGQPSH